MKTQLNNETSPQRPDLRVILRCVCWQHHPMALHDDQGGNDRV